MAVPKKKRQKYERELTEGEEMFCYLMATVFPPRKKEAAVKAGYSESSAHVIASNMLKKDKIKKRINEIKKEESIIRKTTLPSLLASMSDIVNSNLDDFFDDWGDLKEFKKIPRELKALISNVKITPSKDGGDPSIEIKFHDKIRIYDMLMRHYGGYEADNEQNKTDSFVQLNKIVNDFYPKEDDSTFEINEESE